MFVLFFSFALADAPPSWWTEDGITRNSALFGRAQARDAKAYEVAQKALDGAKRAVGSLELADALMAPDAARATYLTGVDRQLSVQFLRLQKHADQLGEDYSRMFGAAVERALPVVSAGATVTECTQIGKMEAMLGRGPRCDGTDISGKVAAAIDQDAELKRQVEDLLTIDWPAIALQGAPQTPVALTGTERTVDAAALARLVAGEQLRLLDETREAAIEELGEALGSPDPSVKGPAVAKGEEIRTTWRKGVAAVGTRLWPDVKKKLEKAAKKGGPAKVALCANPVALGGCGVPDATAEVLAVFREE